MRLHLGSGIPRITQFYPESTFHFTDNFIRMTFPAIEPVYAETDDEAAEQESGAQSGLESGLESIANRVLKALEQIALSKTEMAKALGHNSISSKLNLRVNELLKSGLIERTIPGKPNSRLQKYRLTDKGRKLKLELGSATRGDLEGRGRRA